MTEKPKASRFIFIIAWLWIVGAILKLAHACLHYVKEDMENALLSLLFALIFFGLSILWYRLGKKQRDKSDF